MTNLPPFPGMLSTVTSPLWARTIWRTSDSSRPLPLVLCTSGVSHTVELIENLRLLAGGNADTVIDHFQIDAAVVSIDTDPLNWGPPKGALQ
jgi:hypothetical protein